MREADPDPLLLAAERYNTIRKYTAQFLETFTFCSSRRHDSLLAAIGTLKTLHAAGRRTFRIGCQWVISAPRVVS